MVRVVDWFQVVALYKHCVQKFKEGLKVSNMVALLVQAHDNGLSALEQAGMGYFKVNAIAFQVCDFSCWFLEHCDRDVVGWYWSERLLRTLWFCLLPCRLLSYFSITCSLTCIVKYKS